MKRIIYYLFFLISPFTSCVMDDLSLVSTLMWDEDFDLAPRIPSEATELEVPFIFGTSADWSVVISDPLTKSQSWCSTTQDNGTRSYEITLHLIFEPNDTAEDRVVNVTIKTLFDSVLLVVTQAISEDAPTPEESSITYNDSFALFQSVFADSKVLTPEFVFNATEAWSVECESKGDWISVSNANGEKDQFITLGVKFEENTNEDEEGREGTITISTSKDEVMLTIKQHAKGVSIIPPLDFALEQTVLSSATSLDPPFKFSVQEGWTVTVTPEGEDKWLSVDKTEGEEGNNIPLAITFEANTTDVEKVGAVTITTDGGSSVTLHINQLGQGQGIIPPLDFEFEQTVSGSAGVLTPPFIFSVQEAWTVAINVEAGADEWLSVDQMNGGVAGDDIELVISFKANTTELRKGTVTITTVESNSTVVLTIKQQSEGFSYPIDFDLIQTISSTTLTLDPEFEFSSSELWQVKTVSSTEDYSWFTIPFETDKLTAANDDIAFPITFLENTTYYDRKTTINILSGLSNDVEFQITQLAKPVAELTYNDTEFALNQTVLSTAYGLDCGILFSVQDSWTATVTTVSGTNDWLSINYRYPYHTASGEASNGNYTFPIFFEANTKPTDNIATITLSANHTDAIPVVFTITQEAINVPNGALFLTKSGNLRNDFTEQNFNLATTSLTIVYQPLNQTDWAFLENIPNLTHLDISGTVTTSIVGSNYNIGNMPKCYIPNIEEILLPKTLRIIANGAFRGCTGLTGSFNTILEGVTDIGGYAFTGCTGLTGDLNTVINQRVETIGEVAFAGCTGLTGSSLTIPSYVLIIESFQNFTNLTKVIFAPNSRLMSIGGFSGCTALESITIPSLVETISRYAFRGCTGLTSIIIRCNTPPYLRSHRDGSYSNFDNTNNCPIYVPSGSVEAYKKAVYWFKYADRIKDIATKP